MARMLDKMRSLRTLHSLEHDDLMELVNECQETIDAAWPSVPEDIRKRTGREKPARLNDFLPVIEAFNRDMEAQFKRPSVAHSIIESGHHGGYIPAEVVATLEAIVDLGSEPVADVREGEPDNLDDLL